MLGGSGSQGQEESSTGQVTTENDRKNQPQGDEDDATHKWRTRDVFLQQRHHSRGQGADALFLFSDDTTHDDPISDVEDDDEVGRGGGSSQPVTTTTDIVPCLAHYPVQTLVKLDNDEHQLLKGQQFMSLNFGELCQLGGNDTGKGDEWNESVQEDDDDHILFSPSSPIHPGRIGETTTIASNQQQYLIEKMEEESMDVETAWNSFPGSHHQTDPDLLVPREFPPPSPTAYSSASFASPPSLYSHLLLHSSSSPAHTTPSSAISTSALSPTSLTPKSFPISNLSSTFQHFHQIHHSNAPESPIFGYNTPDKAKKRDSLHFAVPQVRHIPGESSLKSSIPRFPFPPPPPSQRPFHKRQSLPGEAPIRSVSEPDLETSSHFTTPEGKLVKPVSSAFHSTGFLKRNGAVRNALSGGGHSVLDGSNTTELPRIPFGSFGEVPGSKPTPNTPIKRQSESVLAFPRKIRGGMQSDSSLSPYPRPRPVTSTGMTSEDEEPLPHPVDTSPSTRAFFEKQSFGSSRSKFKFPLRHHKVLPSSPLSKAPISQLTMPMLPSTDSRDFDSDDNCFPAPITSFSSSPEKLNAPSSSPGFVGAIDLSHKLNALNGKRQPRFLLSPEKKARHAFDDIGNSPEKTKPIKHPPFPESQDITSMVEYPFTSRLYVDDENDPAQESADDLKSENAEFAISNLNALSTPAKNHLVSVQAHVTTPASLSKLAQNELLAHHHLITPFPLFLDLEFFRKLRLSNCSFAKVFEEYKSTVKVNFFDSEFKMVECIGSGSFSSVYKALSRLDGLFYAVKKASRPFAGYKDAILRLEEVEILWYIRHCPHCVRLERAWVQYGYLYLQMGLCEGGSLQSYLEAQPSPVWDEFRIWHILAEITLAIKEIHDLNIVHLDIKPANIFLSSARHHPEEDQSKVSYKLGDFGFAAVLPLPEGEEREGDRRYIAPEIISDSEYGKPADVFSLGLVILEMATNIILPENGQPWHKLRQGEINECFADCQLSPPLLDLIGSMLQPVSHMRPSADAILSHPFVNTIIAQQRGALPSPEEQCDTDLS